MRRLACLTNAALFTFALAAGSMGAQQAGTPASGVLLEVRGEGIQPLTFTAESFAALPHQTLKARAHDGKEAEYQGVTLAAILARAGAPMGAQLKGKAMDRYLVVEASDGYRAVYALTELDSGFTDRVILLADRRDGKPLSSHEGPLQVIVPGEKKHARWVRQVVRLVVGRAA